MKFLLILTIFALLLVACQDSDGIPPTDEAPSILPTEDTSSEEPYPEPTKYVPPEPSGEYPGPVVEEEKEDQPTPTPLVIPPPGDETGVVTGRLVIAESDDPYYATLYLAGTIAPSDPDYPPLIGFSEQTDPKAVQDENGVFLFVDVPPGEYALLIWSPVGNVVIEDPEIDDYMLFNVEAGEVLDLEIIYIE
jgi:hypothetical protein